MDKPLLLLVEDDAMVMMVAEEALEAGGYAVVMATCGSEALRFIDESPNQIAGLVTDVRLGSGADGWDVARHARLQKPDLAIVYMTADSSAEWPIQGVPNSVLVQKPYAPAQLVSAISSLITAADTNRVS